MGVSLFVKEEELREYGSEVKQRMNALNTFICDYLSLIGEVCESAAISGELHDKLKVFKDRAEVLKNQPLMLADQCTKKIDNYISDIDKADSYIY